MKKNIVLTGFMGTGKSVVGKIIADRTGSVFTDTDRLITEKSGKTIPEIFSLYGEQYFRKLESETVSEISLKNGIVISCGGGVVLNKKNIDMLRINGIIVNLCASAQHILQRTHKSSDRPLLSKSPEQISDMLKQREQFYRNCDISINTDGLTPEAVADTILSHNLIMQEVI